MHMQITVSWNVQNTQAEKSHATRLMWPEAEMSSMAKKQPPKVIIFLQKIKLYILQKYSYSALVRNYLNMNINVL